MKKNETKTDYKKSAAKKLVEASKATAEAIVSDNDLLKEFAAAADERWEGGHDDGDFPEPTQIMHGYEEFGKFLRDFISGETSFLCLGNGGVGKSVYYRKVILGIDDNILDDEDDVDEMVEDVMESEDGEEIPPAVNGANVDTEFLKAPAAHLSGATSAVGLYEFLYTYRDKSVVIDDVIGLLSDPQVLGILLRAAETSKKKVIRWTKQNKILEDKGIPRHFVFKGNIGIFLNAIPRKGVLYKAVRALLTRMDYVVMEPTLNEIHQYAGTWCEDKEVWKWIGDHIYLMNRPHLRYYYRACKWKQKKVDWQKKLVHEWAKADPEATKLKLILMDKKYKTRQDRAIAFVEATGTSVPTFDRRLAQIKAECPQMFNNLTGVYKMGKGRAKKS